MSKANNNIKALDFPESVRKRSVVYMGDSNNSDHALTEAVDNAADHVFRDKTVTKIWIKTCSKKAGDYFAVANDGTSFPIKWVANRGKTECELASVHMHSGSNFEGGNTSIGQNGLGLTCTNALSEFFYIITLLDDNNYKSSSKEVKKLGEPGKYYYIKFAKGIKVTESVGTIDEIKAIDGIDIPKGYSTYIVSKPDPIIYTTDTSASVDKSRIIDSILTFKNFYKRDIKYILDGESVTAKDAGYRYQTLVNYKIADLKYKDILVDEKGNPILDDDGKEQPDTSSRIIKDEENTVDVKILLDYEFSNDLEERTESGNINTRKVPRGMHINKGKELIGQALKQVFEIPHDYLTKGIRINALVLAPGSHLQLAGQTKDSLIRIKCFTDSDWDKIRKHLVKQISKNQKDIAPHVNRLNDYAASLDKLAAKDYVKSMINMNKNATPLVSRKVRDASSKNRDECSLYIVEGNSAASSLLDARTPRIHGVFAMRGFSLNTVGKSLEDVFQNEEYADLITAIGAGVDVYNDLSMARYKKIIICADADSDGAAITNLILGMFGEHLSYLIKDGRIYVNQSPLFEQGGKYLRPDEAHLLDKSKPFTRFKGLGELNIDQARDVFFGDQQRLLRVTEEGLEKALNLILSTDAKKELMKSRGIIK